MKQYRVWLIVASFAVSLLTYSGAIAVELEWELVAEHAQWSPRDSAGEIVYDNKLWILGGWDPYRVNDVWSSDNGRYWHEVTPAAAWSGRNCPVSIAYDDKMWIMAGYSDYRRRNNE